MNESKVTFGDVLAAIGVGLGLIALFVPWYSTNGCQVGDCSLNAFQGRTNLVCFFEVMAVAYYVLFFLHKLIRIDLPESWLAGTVLGSLMVVFTLLDVAVSSRSQSSVSFGWVMELLSAIAVTVGGILTKVAPTLRLVSTPVVPAGGSSPQASDITSAPVAPRRALPPPPPPPPPA